LCIPQHTGRDKKGPRHRRFCSLKFVVLFRFLNVWVSGEHGDCCSLAVDAPNFPLASRFQIPDHRPFWGPIFGGDSVHNVNPMCTWLGWMGGCLLASCLKRRLHQRGVGKAHAPTLVSRTAGNEVMGPMDR
jgi:hypothetical protein